MSNHLRTAFAIVLSSGSYGANTKGMCHLSWTECHNQVHLLSSNSQGFLHKTWKNAWREGCECAAVSHRKQNICLQIWEAVYHYLANILITLFIRNFYCFLLRQSRVFWQPRCSCDSVILWQDMTALKVIWDEEEWWRRERN